MSDADADAAPEAANAAPATKSRKKMILIGAAAALVAGAGGGFFVLGGDDADGGHEQLAEGETAEGESDALFVDVQPMVVNLRSADGQARFLKLRFVIVPESAEAVPEIEARLPLILDAYQPFLRELRPEDLSGSAAVYRIKEEMLVRALDILGEGRVKDILIQDLIQQ